MKTHTVLPVFLISLIHLCTAVQATIIFGIDDVVRPGGPGTANTILLGTGNAQPTTMSVVGDPKKIEFEANNGLFLVYFDPVTLAVGQTLQLDYAIQFDNVDTTARAFRIGMLNSAGGTKYTEDQAAVSPNGNQGYTGYGGIFRIVQESTANNDIFRRDPPKVDLLTPADATLLGIPDGLGATAGVEYNASFAITRTAADSVRIDTQFGAQETQEFFDTSSTVTTFDTIALYVRNGNLTASGTPVEVGLSEFNISVIPEPRVYAITFSALVFIFVTLLRRRTLRS